MKTLTSLFAALLMFTAANANAGELEERSKTFLTKIFAGQYEEAALMISVNSALNNTENLAEFGAGLRAALGEFKQISASSVNEDRRGTLVVCTCDFANGQARVSIVYDDRGKITTITFKPVASEKTPVVGN